MTAADLEGDTTLPIFVPKRGVHFPTAESVAWDVAFRPQRYRSKPQPKTEGK